MSPRENNKNFFKSFSNFNCALNIHKHVCAGFPELTNLVLNTEHNFTRSLLQLRLLKQFRNQNMLIFLFISFAEQSIKHGKARRKQIAKICFNLEQTNLRER